MAFRLSGHTGVDGSEKVESLARRGAISTLPEAESALGIPPNIVIANSRRSESEWTCRFNCKQARLLIKGSTRDKADSLFRRSCSGIRIVTSLLTGDAHLHT